MKLFTSKNNFQEIYSASPKIAIVQQDKDIFLKHFQIENQIDIYEFQFSSSNKSSQENNYEKATILLLGNNSDEKLDLVEIELAPSFFLGLLAFSQGAKQELTELLTWWSKRSLEQSIPKIIELNCQQNPLQLQIELWQQMYHLIAKQSYSIAKRMGTLQKQYLGLRTLHENMQNAFATIEDYLSQAKLPPLQLTFENEPSHEFVEPASLTQSNSLTLKQLLPVSSRGLALIEIHIAKRHNESTGHLTVQIIACQDKTCLAKWQIPYQQLVEGWLGLDLPTIDIGRKKEVELIIDWNTQIGPAPAVSLGNPQPIPEVRVYNNQTTLENSLAFRIWNGLPGTRKVTSPYLSFTDNNLEQVSSLNLGYLGQGAMARVQEVTPNLATEELAYIQIIDNGAKIMTHPRSDGSPTIAMLPFSFPCEANCVTATVMTEHENADVMEYAVAIISPQQEAKTCLENNSALASSGWVRVPPNVPRQITLFLSSIEENCHIVIACKLPPNSRPSYAWTRWLNFELAYKSEDFWEESNIEKTDKEIPEKNLAQSYPSQPFVREFETINSESKPLTISCSLRDKIQIRDVSLSFAEERFTRIQQLENEGKIQVHPCHNSETIAILLSVVPQNTTRVQTVVCTENGEASVIEYALGVIEENDDSQARLTITPSQSTLGFSGWHRVTPNIPYKLDIDIPFSPSKNRHLVLATRIPEDGYEANAWARWLSVEFISFLGMN